MFLVAPGPWRDGENPQQHARLLSHTATQQQEEGPADEVSCQDVECRARARAYAWEKHKERDLQKQRYLWGHHKNCLESVRWSCGAHTCRARRQCSSQGHPSALINPWGAHQDHFLYQNTKFWLCQYISFPFSLSKSLPPGAQDLLFSIAGVLWISLSSESPKNYGR